MVTVAGVAPSGAPHSPTPFRIEAHPLRVVALPAVHRQCPTCGGWIERSSFPACRWARGHKQVALVFAVVVVGYDNNLTSRAKASPAGAVISLAPIPAASLCTTVGHRPPCSRLQFFCLTRPTPGNFVPAFIRITRSFMPALYAYPPDPPPKACRGRYRPRLECMAPLLDRLSPSISASHGKASGIPPCRPSPG